MTFMHQLHPLCCVSDLSENPSQSALSQTSECLSMSSLRSFSFAVLLLILAQPLDKALSSAMNNISYLSETLVCLFLVIMCNFFFSTNANRYAWVPFCLTCCVSQAAFTNSPAKMNPLRLRVSTEEFQLIQVLQE